MCLSSVRHRRLWQVLTVAHGTANPSEKSRVLSSNAELRDQFIRTMLDKANAAVGIWFDVP
jgi:hypothetical protein